MLRFALSWFVGFSFLAVFIALAGTLFFADRITFALKMSWIGLDIIENHDIIGWILGYQGHNPTAENTFFGSPGALEASTVLGTVGQGPGAGDQLPVLGLFEVVLWLVFKCI